MSDTTEKFLLDLLNTASPSGFEEEAARLWRAEAESFADEVWVDVNGNSFARLKGDGPRVLFEGHIDEIGLQISHIDADGYLWFGNIGGWDDQVLTGQHVRIVTRKENVTGVIGRRPAHLLSSDERGKASQIKDLWIDIGARDHADASNRVRVGDPVVIERSISELGLGIISGRGLDNRVGAFVALEALRLLSNERPSADVYAMAATQEEVGFRGARTGVFSLQPDVALVLDVTHATDHPNADKNRGGDVGVGDGPTVARGSVAHPAIAEMLIRAAEDGGIPYQLETAPASSGTDADGIAPALGGIPCGIVSFPCRYMHSPSELVARSDLYYAADLLAAFARSVGPELDLRRV
jgi:putative aminopeptidase FrvX